MKNNYPQPKHSKNCSSKSLEMRIAGSVIQRRKYSFSISYFLNIWFIDCY